MTRADDTLRERLERIAACGIVGAGGAGFPTHVKLSRPAGTIILNAAECEPLMHKDKEILRHFAPVVIDGLRRAARLVGARDVAIGIKRKAEDLADSCRELLGADGRVVELAESYPSGDELILVHDVTGKIVPPGRIPPDVGVVVINVETAYNIARESAVTETFLTVAGAVRRPATLRAPVGMPFGELVRAAGGATVEKPRLLAGGVMMGQQVRAEDPVAKSCGGLVVLPADHPVLARYERDWRTVARIGASACDQCTLCTELCPRYLLGHPIEPHQAMRALGFVTDREPRVAGTAFCCECNLCTMIACPEDLDPKRVCAHARQQLDAQTRRWRPAGRPDRARVHLADRRVPTGRLVRKLGLHVFRDEGPLLGDVLACAHVRLPLGLRAGAASVPVVADGETAEKGQVVARPPDGVLGALVHASISGRCRVSADAIEIVASSVRDAAAGRTPAEGTLPGGSG